MAVQAWQPEGLSRAAICEDGWAAGMVDGLRDVVPVLVAVVPFGATIGVTIAESSIGDGAGWAGAPLLFAGSAHLAAVSLLAAGGWWPAAAATALAINARFMVYSAALAGAWRHQPRWFRWVAPYFLIDQLFALLGSPAAQGRDDSWVRGYYLASAGVLWVAWLAVIAFGVRMGPVLPARDVIAFASPALLTALVMPALRGRPALAAAVVAAAVAVLLRPWLGSTALIAAGATGMAAGWWSEGGGR